ncbi:MAG TPA: response regulator [Candidatus Goldiibacteriota bacterium]|nr:response regulator [Candidatus Goldiibacteriota bacterium]
MKILLVEDNPGDIRLIVETISEGRLPLSVNVARDGEEAVKMITAGAFEPDIIMLDLELPRKSGLEVLEALRANEKTKLTPVIVLSSSESEADITRAYELHANCYVTKPINLDSFVVTINSINNFWLTTARRAK